MNRTVRGMHDIRAGRSLAHHSKPSTRVEVAALLARAEHERERLERELAIWADNQRQAKRRLRIALERIRALQKALAQAPATRGRRAVPRPSRPAHRVVSLEY